MDELTSIMGSMVSRIGTNLSIDDCDADLLELAAHQLVHDSLDDGRLKYLRSQGLVVHTEHECAMAQ
jgi:hypothetical protein